MYLAACGETLNIDFTLPFNEFVPTTCHTRFSLRVSPAISACFVPELNLQNYNCTHYIFSFCFFCYWLERIFWSCCVCRSPTNVNIWLLTRCTCGSVDVYMLCPPQAEDTDMRLSLPECHPSRYPLLTLAKDYQNIKLPPDMFMSGENQGAPLPKPPKSRWRNITHAEWDKCFVFFSFCRQNISVLAKSRMTHLNAEASAEVQNKCCHSYDSQFSANAPSVFILLLVQRLLPLFGFQRRNNKPV